MRDVIRMRSLFSSGLRLALGAAPALCAFAAFAAFACGGTQFLAGASDAGSSDAASVTADQACGDNARGRCTRLAACSGEQMTVDYGTEGACETRLKLNCLNGISAPDTGNAPAHSEACAQAYPSESCADLLDDSPPASCVQPAGTRANGQPCSFPGQCQSAFCAIAPGAPCGTCAAAPNAGDSCAALTTCGQYLACISGAAVCSGFSAQGDACSKSQLCGTGLFCVGATTMSPGSCMPSVETLGAACDPTSRTSAGCDRQQGLVCNSTSKACASLTPYASTGEPCGTVDGQLVVCGGAGACVAMDAGAGPSPNADAAAPTSTTSSACVAPAADGAECDLVVGPTCLSPARCISADGGPSGTCQFPDARQCPTTN